MNALLIAVLLLAVVFIAIVAGVAMLIYWLINKRK